MFKWLIDFVHGLLKDQNSQIITQEDEANGKVEILTGGFVYHYPIKKNGTTILTNNLANVINFISEAKTPKEKEEGEKLYKEVVDREAALMMVSLRYKIEGKYKN